MGNSIGFLAEQGLLGNILQQQVTSGSTLEDFKQEKIEEQENK